MRAQMALNSPDTIIIPFVRDSLAGSFLAHEKKMNKSMRFQVRAPKSLGSISREDRRAPVKLIRALGGRRR